MSAPIIAIDAMGGDFGPHCIVPASIACLQKYPSLHLVLVGQSPVIQRLIDQHSGGLHSGIDRTRLKIVHASETIAMDESPAHALRNKTDASMRIALELVGSGQADACVSAGNTGALMALSRYVLKTLPGIDRPAMITAVPTERGECYLLDLGANVDCSAENLSQFAVMGAVAAEAQGIRAPRVALLNVGTESIKGNQQVRAAAALLQQNSGLNYVGFVEGDGLYRGVADVVVCDGFVGNIVLKSSEGLASMISRRIANLFTTSLLTRALGLMVMPLLKRLQGDLTPAQHNGASLLGLQGIVVKSHGAADELGFQSAVRRALTEIEENLPQRLQGRLDDLLR